jgi:uncharacterized membrane protein YesL
MKNIQKDERVSKKWKTTFSIINGIFWALVLVRIFFKLKDKIQNANSGLKEYAVSAIAVIICIYIVLYISYWLKPSWFYSKQSDVV